MEHVLACNNTRCRKKFDDRALVTTCSHIFCLECVHRLGLAGQENTKGAKCLACHSPLSKLDGAIIANLNPTENYKTSILSGLSPNIIMECAGRALSFWAYQTTQEIFYQQFLYKTLAEKYSNMKLQLEQLANDANSEIERLQMKLTTSAAEQDSMRRKNEELAQAYREKSRKLLQTQEIYDKAKRKSEMGYIERSASDAIESTLRGIPQSRLVALDHDECYLEQASGLKNPFAVPGHRRGPDASGMPFPMLGPTFYGVDEETQQSRKGRATEPGIFGLSRAHKGSRAHLRQPHHGFPRLPRASSAGPSPGGLIRSQGVQTSGFDHGRGSLSRLGLSSGLKASQPADLAGFRISSQATF